ncbi:predicted protein [Sclerotinia sclerotiorum 1980 UF-70]|uniref:Tetraspanin Tsp3 n=1 Tax=Sclerotinia sclerotiorum (strain ATCC 18683 / 1980 / Ss-1) TaxID=665079 RepID=A7EFD0_SCLS1|nr:predicted protein [Sclerotinia sclerotiorum 1980 UF-70]EDO01546.1 predicted protein [Sclerotinia sclerotiorum 1980 UF-70]
MHVVKKLLPWATPLLLLILTVVAIYSYSQIRLLSLPISQALALFTIVLPLVTGISTQGAIGLIQRANKKEQNQLTLPLIAVIGFQLIYETVVATLALTYMIPPNSLHCGLEDKWQKLFSTKNEGNIKAIQDTLNCCGLHSVFDKAWPFRKDVHGPGNCVDLTNRSQSCFGSWRQAEQVNAGLFLIVAIVIFIIKPIHSIMGGDTEAPQADDRAETRRLIEERDDEEESYQDEPTEDRLSPFNGSGQGPRVEPSRLSQNY